LRECGPPHGHLQSPHSGQISTRSGFYRAKRKQKPAISRFLFACIGRKAAPMSRA
jgi:hypothetical protein